MKKGKEYIVSQYDNYQVVKYNYYFENREECENYQVKDNEQVIDVKLIAENYSNFKWVMAVQEVRTIQNNGRFNMTTWKELNKNVTTTANLVNVVEDEKFNAELCNEIAHDAIARKERDLVMSLIRRAAESGCFRTILPKCHSDTMKWLESLDFKVYYQGQTEVSWED